MFYRWCAFPLALAGILGLFAILIPLSSLAAQGSGSAVLAPSQTTGSDAGDWHVPIHTRADDPRGGEYGIWAARPTFKVSFHDGYTFYPFLGSSYPENVPLRWQTERIAVGGRPVLDRADPATARSSIRSSEWRFEYHYPNVIEAYDILEHGVEQTFTLTQRPEVSGDLVVTGRLTTRLVAPHSTGRHDRIVFAAPDGQLVVEYGAAFAVDAAGRRRPMLTSFDGQRIHLRLAGSWLADASYPVTVDPLTSSVVIATGGVGRVADHVSIGHESASTTSNVMIAYARQFSAADWDGFARLVDPDFGNGALVFSDITASWSTTELGVAYVYPAHRWALCMQRDLTTVNSSVVRVYLHDRHDTGLNTGTTLNPPTPLGFTHRYPAIGGVRGAGEHDNGLLVYQSDQTTTQANTPNSEVYGALIDAQAETVGLAFVLSHVPVGRFFDRERPHVNQAAWPADSSWIVVWQELDRRTVDDAWEILGSRIDPAGVVHRDPAETVFGRPTTLARHRARPRVAGHWGGYTGGYYMVLYLRTDDPSTGSGQELAVHRFDWKDDEDAPIRKQIRTVATDLRGGVGQGDLAFDLTSVSHWGAVYEQASRSGGEVHVARLGNTGGTVERATVHASASSGARSPSIRFEHGTEEFMIAYASDETGLPVRAVRLLHSPLAGAFPYGEGCGSATIEAQRPWPGSRNFAVILWDAPPGQAAALLLGVAPVALSLDPLGGAGCWLNVDPTLPLLTVSRITSATTPSAAIVVSLPDVPPLITGDLYCQWFWMDPAAPSAFPAFSTSGLRVSIWP